MNSNRRGPVGMDLVQRHQMILELLADRREVSNADLSRRAGVSEMTIRRDIEALERQGVLNRIRGGATTAVSTSYEPPFAVRSRLNVEAKQRIGEAAAEAISDGETVVLDGGTTTLPLAKALRGRRNLTVCTPSLRIAQILADEKDLRVMITGGVIRHGENTLIGDLCRAAFAELRFDVAFITVSGVHAAVGLTEWDLDDAAVKKAIIASAKRTVVVADSSKLGREAFAHLCGLDQVDELITDDKSETDELDALRETGLYIVTV